MSSNHLSRPAGLLPETEKERRGPAPGERQGGGRAIAYASLPPPLTPAGHPYHRGPKTQGPQSPPPLQAPATIPGQGHATPHGQDALDPSRADQPRLETPMSTHCGVLTQRSCTVTRPSGVLSLEPGWPATMFLPQ